MKWFCLSYCCVSPRDSGTTITNRQTVPLPPINFPSPLVSQCCTTSANCYPIKRLFRFKSQRARAVSSSSSSLLRKTARRRATAVESCHKLPICGSVVCWTQTETPAGWKVNDEKMNDTNFEALLIVCHWSAFLCTLDSIMLSYKLVASIRNWKLQFNGSHFVM